MAIENDKLLNLEDAQVLYNDLRNRDNDLKSAFELQADDLSNAIFRKTNDFEFTATAETTATQRIQLPVPMHPYHKYQIQLVFKNFSHLSSYKKTIKAYWANAGSAYIDNVYEGYPVDNQRIYVDYSVDDKEVTYLMLSTSTATYDGTEKIDVLIYETDNVTSSIDGEIRTIENSLAKFAASEEILNTGWSQGKIVSDGTKGASSKECYTAFMSFSDIGFAVNISIASGYEIQVNEYTSNNVSSFVRKVNEYYATNSFVLHFVSGYYYIITIKKTDNSNLAPADVTTSVIQFSLLDRVSLINDALRWKLISYEQGVLGNDGKGADNSSYVRSDYIPIINFYKMYKPIGIRSYLCCYAEDKTFIYRYGYDTGYNSLQTYISVLQAQPTTKYIRISAGIPNETVTPDDIISSDFDVRLIFDAEANDAKIKKIEEDVEDIKEVTSANALAPNNVEKGLELDKAINADGSLSDNTWYATTGFIEVKPGDVVIATNGKNNDITLARVVTYDDKKGVKSGNTTSVASFTVPDGVKYIRFCANKTYMNSATARINLDGVRHSFEPYYQKNIEKAVQWNATRNSDMLLYPLTSLPEYIVKNLAYKPLGVLSKGYICIVSDDGNSLVASYTIPMFISKDVPCTLAIMKASPVLQTQEGLEAVLNAIENYGFNVAQHGGSYWITYYDEYGLNKFFDDEKTYWDSVGITPYGACAPGGLCNDMICALSGARFGCHRTANRDSTLWYGESYYINGPRSNIYNLTSVNITDHSDINWWKDRCDLTLTNKWLMMIHLHENQLDAELKEKFEAVIDYAKQIGLTFITMKEIPTIT